MNGEKIDSASAMFEGDDSIWWVTGGLNGNFLSTTEVFHVNSNSFSYGVSLPEPLDVHNLVNVNNTHMVVLGGYYPSDQIYIIDRNLQVWSSLPSMPTARSWCQAGFVTYRNGDKGILVAGGDSSDTVDFLNLDTLIWEPKQNLPFDIYRGASVPFQDGFLIVGGESDSQGYLDTIYYYNPTLDQWDLLDQRMKDKRETFTAFLVPDYYANCS